MIFRIPDALEIPNIYYCLNLVTNDVISITKFSRFRDVRREKAGKKKIYAIFREQREKTKKIGREDRGYVVKLKDESNALARRAS